MTLFRVLDGCVQKNGEKFAEGKDIDLTPEEVERLNKNGRKTVEPTSVAKARLEAEEKAKKSIADAEKKAKDEAEEKAKKGGAK